MQPYGIEAGDQHRNAGVPLRVSQTYLAIDKRQRIGIAGNAGEKA